MNFSVFLSFFAFSVVFCLVLWDGLVDVAVVQHHECVVLVLQSDDFQVISTAAVKANHGKVGLGLDVDGGPATHGVQSGRFPEQWHSS